MEKNELSRIPDLNDSNDPLMPTDNANSYNGINFGSAPLNTFKERERTSEVDFIERGNKIHFESSSAAGRRNIEKEMNVPYTCANRNTFNERARTSEVEFIERGNKIHFESSSAAGRRNIEMEMNVLATCANLNTFNERARTSEVEFIERENKTDLESSSGKHEKHQPNDTNIDIEELAKFLGTTYKPKDIHVPVPQCCIYKVPKELRKINRQAYTPQVISIGPFHHGNKALVEMEKQKLRYILEFQQKREGAAGKLEEFKTFIEDNERLIRNYYQEKSSLKGSKFVNMILRDAVFIIELFLRNMEPKTKRGFDFFIDTPCVKAAIACDLQLLENQLPYLLLKKLFEKLAFLNFTKEDPFLTLSYLFLFDPKNRAVPQPKKEMQGYEIQHFTDLRRYFLLMDFLPRDKKQGEHVRGTAGDQNQGEHIRDLPTATKLHGSGVKFKKGIEGGSSLKISCEPVPCAMRIPGFKGCEIQIPFMKTLELQIPRLEIDDRSECLYRNMMALELCHYPSETHICNFILLMDYLINTEKDVDLFVDKEIIFSMLGDNAKVATMFNNLCLQITQSHSVYHDIGERLKEHYRGRWNHTMATLTTVYFGDIWKGTATVAAFILLVLTVIQAISSILSLL